jgi:hypothetical protein
VRSGWQIAAGLAALALVGCHGPTIIEAPPDGGGRGGAGTGGNGGAGGNTGAAGGAGTTGTAGTTGIAGTGGAGRGGSTGTGGIAGAAGRGGGGGGGGGTAGRGGTGGNAGAGCAAQMTPQMFYRGGSPPVYTAETASRLYWVEFGSPSITIHYTAATSPAEIPHPLALGSSGIGNYDITARDSYVVATWGLNGEIAIWGPDQDSMQLGRMTLSYPSAVAIDGATVFYSFQPQTGSATQGIYTWNPSGSPVLFESYSDLGGDRTLGLLLRTTPTRLLLSDRTDIWFVDRTAKGAKQLLFNNPTTRLITEVRPARPRTTDGPVIVSIDDPILVAGRDYYVNLSQPTAAPKDLGAATTALANSSACGNAAVFNGVGVMYQQRYIYEGNGGLFAVDVSSSGAVSNLVRLTDTPFSYPDVTESGDLFAGTVYNVSKWDYYRIGKL